MKTIRQTYEIRATPEQVWRALTDPDLIAEWSGAPAEFPLEVGATYSLWSGDIGGQIMEMVPNQRLVQTWEPEGWTTEDSVVAFVLVPTDLGTRIELVHENVEDWDYEDTSDGWDSFYLGAIKRMLEAETPDKRRVAEPQRAAKKTARAKKAASPKKTVRKRATPRKKTATKGAARRGSKRAK